ncbi:hypothetical protein TWF102_011911 [Orbilia oligospora]|uniref:Uncharacterized protein n=1 Tax=Orbilia oligospora TaxID=2813651 RepID=A0A7C8J2L6_ORBOL|nr:hypothetical protein TWF102_011911 [Orbilia oligospora]KAF3091782.1 hypothetical protein TWF706_009457 [Orbilia oligospora]
MKKSRHREVPVSFRDLTRDLNSNDQLGKDACSASFRGGLPEKIGGFGSQHFVLSFNRCLDRVRTAFYVRD